MDRERFSQCPCCEAWFSSQDILAGPDIEPLGMTFETGDTRFNLIYFNHRVPGCGSTFTIEARRLEPFLSEIPPPDVMAGQLGCDNHCTSMNDLAACDVPCCWAPYRRFLLQLRSRRDIPTT